MTDPLVALLSALPGLAKAGADIASASDQAKRNAQLIEFQKAVIGLQSDIAAVQAQNATLAARNRDLENEISKLGDWENEKKRYALVSPWGGANVYALRKSMSNEEVPHWLCANCFQERKKVFLTQQANSGGWGILVCPVCKAQMATPWRGQIPAKFAEEYPQPT